MRRVWLQQARDAIRRNDHRDILAGAVAGLGAALVVARDGNRPCFTSPQRGEVDLRSKSGEG
jgi:hypothetical protein